ncbi:hypothetical protein NS359_08020 [Curtobacterium oceanosedimentum]|uniref:HTH marR-type domain-containing protein n=1 Tax=Curtobacterium oceanosedimentum TaxID=465820 RepID=A0A147DR12_9MICO|nr:hypothetical protein NS359_08020 [Curtobacterium oceanosedimentum]
MAAAWSKRLFGDSHFLHVANAISVGAEELDALELRDALQLSQSAVRRVLIDLEAVSLLERLERPSRTARQRYRRAAHPFWAATAALYGTAAERDE